MYVLNQTIQYIPVRRNSVHLISSLCKNFENLIIELDIKYWLNEYSRTFQSILKRCFRWIYPPSFLLGWLHFQFCTHFFLKYFIFERPSIPLTELICSILFCTGMVFFTLKIHHLFAFLPEYLVMDMFIELLCAPFFLWFVYKWQRVIVNRSVFTMFQKGVSSSVYINLVSLCICFNQLFTKPTPFNFIQLQNTK